MSKVENKRRARKIWLVPHPTSQFKEDVKTLAMQNNLKIVDAKFASAYPSEMIATKTPSLTSLTEQMKAAKVAEAEAATIEAAEAAEAAELAEMERKYRLELEMKAKVDAEFAAKKK